LRMQLFPSLSPLSQTWSASGSESSPPFQVFKFFVFTLVSWLIWHNFWLYKKFPVAWSYQQKYPEKFSEVLSDFNLLKLPTNISIWGHMKEF
jgi:hypothetical protein